MTGFNENLGVPIKKYHYKVKGRLCDFNSFEAALICVLEHYSGHVNSLHGLVTLVKDNIVRYEETTEINIKGWDKENFPEPTISY